MTSGRDHQTTDATVQDLVEQGLDLRRETLSHDLRGLPGQGPVPAPPALGDIPVRKLGVRGIDALYRTLSPRSGSLDRAPDPQHPHRLPRPGRPLGLAQRQPAKLATLPSIRQAEVRPSSPADVVAAIALADLELIGIAEEIGLIERLGTWVIEEACRQVADWHRRFPGVPPLVVSVNVSACHLDPQLIETVGTALVAAGAMPQQLCLELTASASIGDFDVAVATLTRLRALGVRLSMDNFGTGYALLSYLKRLPVQELKIDRSFLTHVATDPNETALLAATVSMAHALGLPTVAVGVETAEQLEHLRRRGCEEVQGYLISRPKPVEELDPLLAGCPDIQ